MNSAILNQNKKPTKKKWLFITVLFVILLGGGIIYLYYLLKQKPESNTNQQTTTQSPTTTSQTSKGLVKLNEIGCRNSNLFVISATSGESPVDKEGNYQASFSTSGAQLVYVTNDQDTVCASAISLPKYQNKIFFNAKSTAKALVFQSIGILTTDPAEAENRLGKNAS